MSSKPTNRIAKDIYLKEYSNDFVDRWDELINWKGRKEAENGFFQRILRENGAKSVLDIGCGTGFHTCDFARDGFDVTGADGAATMVEKARENAERLGLHQVEFHVAEWTSLTSVFPDEKFDAIVCLGNALTHLFEEKDRIKTLTEVYSLLNDGGVAIIDHRNYDRILDEGYSSKHKFYYTGDEVEVYPDEVSEQTFKMRYQYSDGSFYHLTMCPIRKDYVSGLLKQVGFKDIQTFGDFKPKFDISEPDFIVQVAKK
ncbi:MAG: methyltransferase domain-containing protein [Dehalococcoidia bacterium]